MTHATLADLRAYTLENAGAAAPVLADFVPAYFDNTDPDELQQRGPATLLALASAHWRLLDLASDDPDGRIRVFNPTLAEDGFVSEQTVIQIVHDDMPFLVDSVTMAINRSGRMVHWIVHPLLAVERDANANVKSARLATLDAQHDHQISSLILVECDRILLAEDRAQLAAELALVLYDVRAAVSDWEPMLRHLQAAREASALSPLSAKGQQEGVEFLLWLEAQHFTFLGARDYELVRDEDGINLVAIPDSGLGILRGEPKTPVSRLPVDAFDFLDSDQLVLVTKAMTRATVHRPAWLDCLTVKRFDATGKVIGEARFLGLYTSKAYAALVGDIPQIRRRAADVMAAVEVLPESHAAKSLQTILDDYPRDELFQVDTATLIDHAVGILRLQERQRVRVFLRRDPFGRFTSAQVFVPRDRYNTELRSKIGDELSRALDGQSIEFTPTLTNSPLARIHYLVRARQQAPQNVDVSALELRITQLCQRWEDHCKAALLHIHGESQGLALASRFADSFPTVYQKHFSGRMAADDVQVLAGLSTELPMAVRLYRTFDSSPGMVRFKIFSLGKVALSDSLPVLERMGARVLDEHPYQLQPVLSDSGASDYWIHDLGLQLPPEADFAVIRERFEALFVRVWCKVLDSDDLNKLVLATTLDARAIAVLRAYTRYFKQLDFPYSQNYLEATLY
ncbi:MAG TPA: NAD-glutamate dehydrogenase, partial [Rhodoferax sp.]|nr:NAD-glutamate dehydrogenase [Rhodoferax sp.]